MGITEGTQNINPGRYNLLKSDGSVQEDLSSRAFYRVIVSGKNVMKVDRGGDVLNNGRKVPRKK